ncbi:hypothetical protein ACFSNO_29275 [Streptomyces cirratus]
MTGVSAHTLLRVFVGGPERWCGLDVLRPDQVAALERPPVPPGRERHTLDEAELALLSVLGRDGRPVTPNWRAPRACRSPPRAGAWSGCGSSGRCTWTWSSSRPGWATRRRPR